VSGLGNIFFYFFVSLLGDACALKSLDLVSSKSLAMLWIDLVLPFYLCSVSGIVLIDIPNCIKVAEVSHVGHTTQWTCMSH
jgi:hypothetical protein